MGEQEAETGRSANRIRRVECTERIHQKRASDNQPNENWAYAYDPQLFDG